ncbi:hypothetical protein GCM10023080_044340 [Streptomyces pseudoechinosporeus]
MNEPETTDARAEDLDRLRNERDRLLAERERLRREVTEPDPPSPSRRRLLIGAGAAVAATAVAVPTGIALVGDADDGGKDDDRKRTARTGPGTPTPLRTPPPVAIPAKPRLRLLATLRGHEGEIVTFRFSPDGTSLASSDGDVRLWDAATGKERAKPLYSGTVFIESLAFSPDGRTLATGGGDRVQFWDAATLRPQGPQITKSEEVQGAAFPGVAFSPDGRILVTHGDIGDPGIQLYYAATRKKDGEPLSWDEVATLVFSPDGRTVAGVDESGTQGVRLWDLNTRKQRAQAAYDFFGGVQAMAFSPDSRTLAVANDSGGVLFFDPATGKENGRPLTGHTGFVTGLAYSTDGKSVLTADYAGFRVWNAATRDRRADLEAPVETISQLAFSPDGRTLATVGFQDRTIHLWRLE